MERSLITPVPASDKQGQGPCCTDKAMGEVRVSRMFSAKAGGVDENARPGGCRGSPEARAEGLGSANQHFQI